MGCPLDFSKTLATTSGTSSYIHFIYSHLNFPPAHTCLLAPAESLLVDLTGSQSDLAIAHYRQKLLAPSCAAKYNDQPALLLCGYLSQHHLFRHCQPAWLQLSFSLALQANSPHQCSTLILHQPTRLSLHEIS